MPSIARPVRLLFVGLVTLTAGCEGPAPSADAGAPPDAGRPDGGATGDAGLEPDGGSDAGLDAGPDTDGGVDGGAACGAGVALEANDVLTKSGVVRGALINSVRTFKGIPYAKPPVGALRWRLPESYGCFTQPVRDATSPGAICPQYLSDGGVVGDEDCLTLEVWAPVVATTALRPVMVFIHGGAHEQGSATNASIDGALLAASQGNLVVSLEYRLGPFGFLAHPALSAEGGAQKSGDYGMHDQLAGLKWVKDNIEGFGGDPNKVLIFGESAGAVSVCRLVASPLATGLFSSAIMESGACGARSLAQAEQVGQVIAAQAGCPDAGLSTACLRAKTTAEVMAGFSPTTNLSSEIGDLTFDGVVDGYAVPDVPRLTIGAGQFTPVPMIIVTNANELSRGVPGITTEQQFRAAMTVFLGTKATPALVDQVVLQYAVPGSYPTFKAAYVAAISEATIICASRRDALTLAAKSSKPVYRAIFADVVDNATPAIAELGAFHGAELLWVFGTLNTTPLVKAFVGPLDQQTSAAMQAAWSSFAGTGTPTGATVPSWPSYSAANEQAMVFKDGATVKADPFVANCMFWESAL